MEESADIPIEIPVPTSEIVVSVAKVKTCISCKEEKPTELFFKNRYMKDGRQSYCKVCMNLKVKKRLTEKGKFKLGDIGGEKHKQIAHILIDNPRADIVEVAQLTGLTPASVKTYMTSHRVLRALRAVGAKEVTRMIPQALRAMSEVLNGVNVDVKFKAASKILESERVMGPNRIEIGVTDMANESTERLLQIVKEAKNFPEQTIQEAQVIE